MESSPVMEPTGFSTEDSSPDSSEFERTGTDSGTAAEGTREEPEAMKVKGGPTEQPSLGDRKDGLFPDLSKVDWYLEPRFQRYWKHYHQVMTWYQKHLETYRMLNSSLNAPQEGGATASSSRFNPYASLHRTSPSARCRAAGRGSGSASSKPRSEAGSSPWLANSLRKEQKTQPNKSYTASGETTSVSKGSSAEVRSADSLENKLISTAHNEEFEMEITDEMVEFFAQSRRHKKERDAARNTPSDDNKEKHVDIEQATAQRKPATTEAPKERPGVRRTQEMKMLYGKGAAMIHGMETAIQMTYDRNTDIKQPKLWPNMPLKIVFG